MSSLLSGRAVLHTFWLSDAVVNGRIPRPDVHRGQSWSHDCRRRSLGASARGVASEDRLRNRSNVPSPAAGLRGDSGWKPRRELATMQHERCASWTFEYEQTQETIWSLLTSGVSVPRSFQAEKPPRA